MSRARSLRNPARIVVEVAVSKITGQILLRVESSGVEQFWADGVRELVVDLGREDLLVLRPGAPPERQQRE